MLKHPTLVLITLMLGTSMAAIDSSIVNVSLPVIRHQFNVNVDEIEWVITAYMISFTLFIPLITWLKNRVGYFYLYHRQRGHLYHRVVAMQPVPQLYPARHRPGNPGQRRRRHHPTSLAILSESFPHEKRGSVIGWWGLGNVMGPALGPYAGRRPHPLLWLGIRLRCQYPDRHRHHHNELPIPELSCAPALDAKDIRFRGFAWFALFIVSLQYTISTISKMDKYRTRQPDVPPLPYFSTCISAAPARNPIPCWTLQSSARASSSIPPSLSSSVVSAFSAGCSFCLSSLQGLLGYTTIQSGLLMFPNALMMLVARPYAGKKADEGLIRNISLLGYPAGLIFHVPVCADRHRHYYLADHPAHDDSRARHQFPRRARLYSPAEFR